MRTVFLGTPDFAVPSLNALLSSPQHYDIQAVITQPDRPAGRGRRLTPPPVKEVAQAAGIIVLQPERLRRSQEVFDLLHQVQPDFMVVVAFGQLLPREFFDYAPFGTINVHASLLPKYRGASPIVHAILNGETETGITIMKIDEGMDTGDVLNGRSLPIGSNMTSGELECLLAQQGAELLVETLPPYFDGTLKPVPQDDSEATYAPRVRKEDAVLSWNRPAAALHNSIRAYNPWPVAWTGLRGQTVKVWASRQASPAVPSAVTGESAGEILAVDRDGITVRCGDETRLVLTELQLPGRNRLPAAEFSRGIKLRAGERFGEE